MRNLPFKKVAQIEQICSNLPLDGLALILTRKEGHGGVLVYLDQIPLFSLPNEWQFKELGELQEEDFLTWDGLAVGYDSLNLQYPLLLTLGPNFYPIRYLFVAINRLDIYQENARKLALWLYQKNSEANLSNRFFAKLIELLAPSWLETNRSAGSIGLALNTPDLLPFLIAEKQPKWVTLADLENEPASADFLLTFDEIKQFIPGLTQCPHFIEWRPILWKNGKQNLLIDALDEMAQFLEEQAEKQNQPQLRHQAYAFALEKWLTQMDTEHLIAVFPNGDFECFLKTGNAIFIKQMPKIYVGAEHPQEFFTLIDLLNREPKLQDTIGKAYGGTPFCIQPLLKSAQVLTSSDPWPLEKVLYAVGKASSLSATFLSLVSDFIRYDEDIKSAQFSAEQIRDIALKGTYLLALGDPWNQAWRGRFSLLLDEAYAILDDALLYNEKARPSQESRLLRAWYGLYREANVSHRWDELQRLEQEFFGNVSGQEKNILNVLAGQKIPDVEAKQIRDLQYAPILWQETMPILTGGFWGLYHDWRHVHRERTAIEQNLLHTSPSTQEIEQVLNEYRRIQRRLYALPHEVIILQHLCSEDVNALKRLLSALQKDIAIQVHLLTSKIFLGQATRLLFEAQNIGDQDAKNIELFLEASPQYEIIEEKASQYLSYMPAHTGGYRLEWHIRAQEDGLLKIRLKSNLSKINEYENEQFEFSLSVIGRNEKVRGPRGGNPFQAGVAVDGDKFFGRHKELRPIFDLLLYGTTQPVLLRGPRRVGKTSILHQIEYLLTNPGELQHQLGYSDEDEMQLRLIKPVFTTLNGIDSKSEIPGWYFDLFIKVLETTGSTLDSQINYSAFESDPQHVFERHIKQFLNNHNEMRLVILLDEWDEQLHLTELGGKLRALIQNEKRLNWVISSTWMLSAEQGRYGSQFYGQTRSFELKEMSWEEARNMVKTLSERVEVTWKEEALTKLLTQTASRPYLIQALGQRIIEKLGLANPPSNEVDTEKIQMVIDDFVRGTATQDSYFSFLWDDKTSKSPHAYLSWLGRLILLTLENPEQNLNQNLEQISSKPLKLIEIRNSLHKKYQEQDAQLHLPISFDDDIEENLNQLELIFDVIKMEGDHYSFSIPLAQTWFHNTIRQHDDPWQFAFERLRREYKKFGRTNKEQK